MEVSDMKNMLALLTALFLQGCSVFGISSVETLDYRVIDEEDNFTIRQYDDYWVARTIIEGEYEESTDKGFNLLFSYISGKNSQKEKISMTAPVLQREQGEKIAMTSPVLKQKKEDGWVMEFVLPSKYNASSPPPQPFDPQVSVVQVEGYKAAALRYSGNLSEEKYQKKTAELLDIVNRRGLQRVGEPFSAGYNPPWTLPFLKRNEVLVVVQ